MPSPTPRQDDEEYFPPPSSTRPPVLQDFGSDSSVDTLSSFTSSADSEYSSGDHPYSRLVVVDARPMGPPNDGAWDTSVNLAETGGSQSHPGTRSGSFAIDDDEPAVPQSSSFVPPSSFATPSPTTLRHQSLPGLVTAPEAERRDNTTPKASLFAARHSAPPSAYEAVSFSPDHSPVAPYSSAFASFPSSSFASTSTARFPAPTSSAITASMSRSQSSLSELPSPRSNRPSSSSTFGSSTSTRPWVRDSDASSVCSGGSGGCWSGPGGEDDDDGSGEVMKVAADGVEFLDPRPEPPGAKLSISREHPDYVLLTFTLPDFDPANITVAMRRGYKLHLVADSYGEDGGHFEKLISLGSRVSSDPPRAEFDGTYLNVYVLKRMPSSRVVALPGKEDSISPPFSPSSPSSSSISSFSSLTSPPMHTASTFIDSEDEPPIVTRSTAEFPDSLHKRNGSKTLTGPEGAKAAARKAREEAAQRAREEAKALPKIGRRVVLGKEARAADSRGRESSDSSEHEGSTEPLAVPPGRNGTIKGRSPSPISPVSISDSTSSADSASTRSSIDSISTDASSVVDNSSTSPARPKLGSNLTLRPGDRTSFLEASLREDQRMESTSPSSEGSKSEGGSATPKVERGESFWGFGAGAPAGRKV